jgi:hypothetical protein
MKICTIKRKVVVRKTLYKRLREVEQEQEQEQEQEKIQIRYGYTND